MAYMVDVEAMTTTIQVKNLYPTHDQVVNALLNAILTHPQVTGSQIFYPVLLGDTSAPAQILITSARDFGGMEFLNPGLTLAVYPLHTGFDQKTVVFPRIGPKAVTYKDTNLGRYGDGLTYPGVNSTFSLIVQIFYLDPTFYGPVTLTSDLVTGASGVDYNPSTILPAELVQYTDPTLPANTQTLAEFTNNSDATITPTTLGSSPTTGLAIYTLPGEKIMRTWMSLLVSVVRSLRELRPFSIRNPSIEYVDYPTTNWLRKDPNLIFHTAYMVVTYDTTEPANPGSYTFPMPATSTSTSTSTALPDITSINITAPATADGIVHQETTSAGSS